jgi:hypothetical protein
VSLASPASVVANAGMPAEIDRASRKNPDSPLATKSPTSPNSIFSPIGRRPYAESSAAGAVAGAIGPTAAAALARTDGSAPEARTA